MYDTLKEVSTLLGMEKGTLLKETFSIQDFEAENIVQQSVQTRSVKPGHVTEVDEW